MRTGIMAMQLGALIPPGLPPEAMMAHIAGFDHAALVLDLHGRGFDPIELGGDLAMFIPHAFAPAAIERLTALKTEIGVSYTVHLPLWSVEPAALLEPVRLASVRSVLDIIRATLPLQPEVYVYHPTGSLAAEFNRMPLPELGRALILRRFQAAARESLRAILAETGIPSRQLAIETIEFPFDMTLELAEEFDLSLCLDTAHILCGFSGPIDVFEALERTLPRLAEVHLNDARRWTPGASVEYGADHWPLGTGDLDLGRLLDRLAAVGFNGPVVMELTVPEAEASMQEVRKTIERRHQHPPAGAV